MPLTRLQFPDLQLPDLACCTDTCRAKSKSKEPLMGVGMNFKVSSPLAEQLPLPGEDIHFFPESQGQNLALTVLYVPSLLDSGWMAKQIASRFHGR